MAPHKLHIISLSRSLGKAASFDRRTFLARRYAHSAVRRFPMKTRYAGLFIGKNQK